VRGARRGVHRAHHDHAIDWLDVCLAGMLVVEAASHHQETNHWPRPTLLLAATMLAAGLTHGRVMSFARRRRSLRIESTGLSRGLRFFRRFSATWDRIVGIRIGESRAVIALKGGEEHVIDLADLDNADRVREALQAAHRKWEEVTACPRN
jgi:NADH dehydrogenase FAD-containing subunit